MNYPTTHPASPYLCIQKSVEAAAILAATREFLNTVKGLSDKTDKIIYSNITDAIVRPDSAISSLATQNESAETHFQQMFPFLKVGERLINPALITAIDFQSIDDNENQCTEVGFGDSSAYFYGEEAEILKRFFLSGSKAYDLNNLFG